MVAWKAGDKQKGKRKNKTHGKAINLQVKQTKHGETNNPNMQSEEVRACQQRYYELKKRNEKNAENWK